MRFTKTLLAVAALTVAGAASAAPTIMTEVTRRPTLKFRCRSRSTAA